MLEEDVLDLPYQSWRKNFKEEEDLLNLWCRFFVSLEKRDEEKERERNERENEGVGRVWPAIVVWGGTHITCILQK